MSGHTEYLHICEALLFLADEPRSLAELSELMAIDPTEVESLLRTLLEEYAPGKRGVYLRAIAGGYQFFATPAVEPFLEAHFEQKKPKLSNAALETLAIIAYRAPVTRADIEQIRGVSCDGPLRLLQDRGLVEERGRKDAPGRPILYGTTEAFLVAFGLNSPEELPKPAPTPDDEAVI